MFENIVLIMFSTLSSFKLLNFSSAYTNNTNYIKIMKEKTILSTIPFKLILLFPCISLDNTIHFSSLHTDNSILIRCLHVPLNPFLQFLNFKLRTYTCYESNKAKYFIQKLEKYKNKSKSA